MFDDILDYIESLGVPYAIDPHDMIVVDRSAWSPMLMRMAVNNGYMVTRDSEGNYVIGKRNLNFQYPIAVGAIDADSAASWASRATATLASILGLRNLRTSSHVEADFIEYDFGPGAAVKNVPTSDKLVKVLHAFPSALLTAVGEKGLRISIPNTASSAGIWDDTWAESGSLVGHGADNDGEYAWSSRSSITNNMDRWSGALSLERAGEFAGQLYPRVDSFGYGG